MLAEKITELIKNEILNAGPYSDGNFVKQALGGVRVETGPEYPKLGTAEHHVEYVGSAAEAVPLAGIIGNFRSTNGWRGEENGWQSAVKELVEYDGGW